MADVAERAGVVRRPVLLPDPEPRPIRVFLQDGSNDLNIYGGDWWMANQEMERSLTFAGYEVQHAWDEGGHSGAGRGGTSSAGPAHIAHRTRGYAIDGVPQYLVFRNAEKGCNLDDF